MRLTEFDYIEMKLPAKSDYVSVARLTASGIANRMGFDYEAIEDLKVAVSEASTNVVTHAYNEDEHGDIILGFSVYSDKIEVMVSDRGESFDVKEVKKELGPIENTEKTNELREGGFGLFLINALMDKVEVNNSYGVIVQMTKYINEVGVSNGGSITTS